MNKEEYECFLLAIKTHPQIFYDIFVDPSFIRLKNDPNDDPNASSEGSYNDSAKAISDRSKVYDFFTKELNLQTKDMEILDVRNTQKSRTTALNPELAPFYAVRDFFSTLLKIKYDNDNNNYIAIWSPTKEKAEEPLVGSMQSILKTPPSEGFSLKEQLARLENVVNTTAVYEYLKPLIDEAQKEDFGFVSQYSKYINDNFKEAVQPGSQNLIKAGSLSVGQERDLFVLFLRKCCGEGGYLNEDFKTIFKEQANIDIGKIQKSAMMGELLRHFFDIEQMEQSFQQRNEVNIDDEDNMGYFLYKNILRQFGSLFGSVSRNQEYTIDDMSPQYKNFMKNAYKNAASDIITRSLMVIGEKEKIKDMSKEQKEKKLSKEQAEEKFAQIKSRFGEMANEISKDVVDKINKMFYPLVAVSKNLLILRIITNNMQQQRSSGNMTLNHEAARMNFFMCFSVEKLGVDLSQHPEIKKICEYYINQIKKEAYHAAAYKFARFCVPVESGELVKISLVNKFKGDSPEAQQNRINCLVLEMLLQNPNPLLENVGNVAQEEQDTEVMIEITPESQQAMELYNQLNKPSHSADDSKEKRLRSNDSQIIEDLVTKVRTGDISIEMLKEVAQLTKQQRSDFFSAMHPNPTPEPTELHASRKLRG